MTDGDTTDLREELSFYDDSFPRDDPDWDEKSIVTPRAFLSEIGYDLPGRRIPGQLARHLIEADSTTHTITMMRLFGSTPEEFRDTTDAKQAARMLTTDAYNAVEVYRIDAHDYTDTEGVIEGFASGGFLIKYANIMDDGELKRTEHDRYGYYWMDNHGQNQLIKKLLDDPKVYGDPAADRADYLKQDWEQKPNPAAGESWRVVRLNSRQHSTHLADLARDNLLYPGVEDVYAVEGASADAPPRKTC